MHIHNIDPTGDAVRHPQSSATFQPHHQQTLTFTENLNYEQLAVWLTNHQQFMGADYQQDIGKLKGTYNIAYSTREVCEI